MNLEALTTGGPPKQVGRYTIFQQIAAGGMATVHLARFTGPAGFTRIVAVKHLHAHLSSDPKFRAMFIDEALLVSRIRHRNVVPTLDVIIDDGNIFLVMEYVQGESLSALRRIGARQRREIPLPVCSAILIGVLYGLHAAHEARSEFGEPLNIVHRDVSPSNILVGVDGIPVVLDFGVAKALQAREDSAPGTRKGKAAYMSAEQIRGDALTRATDIFAAAVVFWELLTSRRLFGGATDEERMAKVLEGDHLAPPSSVASRVPAALDEIAMKGLRANPAERYQTALEMADAIERAIPPASQRVVGGWVADTAAESLSHQAELLHQIEFPGKRELLADEADTPRAVERAELKPAGFFGVCVTSLTDWIHLVQMGRRDATLIVRTLDGREATLWCRSGDVIDAVCDGLDGEGAFYRALSWQSGTISVHFGAVAHQRRIQMTTGGLLLLAARRMVVGADERESPQPSPMSVAPPPSAPKEGAGVALLRFLRFLRDLQSSSPRSLVVAFAMGSCLALAVLFGVTARRSPPVRPPSATVATPVRPATRATSVTPDRKPLLVGDMSVAAAAAVPVQKPAVEPKDGARAVPLRHRVEAPRARRSRASPVAGSPAALRQQLDPAPSGVAAPTVGQPGAGAPIVEGRPPQIQIVDDVKPRIEIIP